MTATQLTDDELDTIFTALADSTRREILTLLADGDLNPSDLTEPFDISQQAVSKHIKVLERAGLISRSRLSRSRPCRLEPDRLVAAAAWVEEHRRLWEARHDQLQQHLQKIQRGANSQ